MGYTEKKNHSLFIWYQNLTRHPVCYLATLRVVLLLLSRYILIGFFLSIRVVFWWSVSCGEVEVHGFCTSEILLSWQLQTQVDIKSGAVTQHLRAEWPEAEILLAEPVGKEPCKLAVWACFRRTHWGARSFSNSPGRDDGNTWFTVWRWWHSRTGYP